MSRQVAAAVSPWMFWGAFGASLLAIIGLWLLTLPQQWTQAERPFDRPRWSLLDRPDPAGRLKAQLEVVSDDFAATSAAITTVPDTLRAQRLADFAAQMTLQLQSRVPPEPTPATTADTAPVSAPSVPTP